MIGWGIQHAFGQGNQHLALLGPTAEVEAYKARFDNFDSYLAVLDDETERLMIAGPSTSEAEVLRYGFGYKPELAWQVALDRAEIEQHVAGGLAVDADLNSRVDDVIAAGEIFHELMPLMHERFDLAGVGSGELMNLGRDGMTRFIDLLPSSVVRRTLRKHVQRNVSRMPSVNDVSDADLYAVLMPRCDLVVAEASAHHALTAAKVDKQFGVNIIKRLVHVPAAITELLAS
ncbi:MAG: hypothetical protein JWQ64_2386 [Subtercola sp.]|nr:hypothetical protein [Subtercola sp.]